MGTFCTILTEKENVETKTNIIFYPNIFMTLVNHKNIPEIQNMVVTITYKLDVIEQN